VAKSSPMANGWAAQTKMLCVKRYFSETPGIWTDRVTRRDRASGVTDTELKRIHKGRGDCSGNLPPVTKWEAAKQLVERALNGMSLAQRDAVTPRMKWEMVERVAGN